MNKQKKNKNASKSDRMKDQMSIIKGKAEKQLKNKYNRNKEQMKQMEENKQHMKHTNKQ